MDNNWDAEPTTDDFEDVTVPEDADEWMTSILADFETVEDDEDYADENED